MIKRLSNILEYLIYIVCTCFSLGPTELIESGELLGVPFETLKLALTTRNSDYKVELTCTEANYEKDVLIRNLYSRLFTWIVSEVNRAINVSALLSLLTIHTLNTKVRSINHV